MMNWKVLGLMLVFIPFFGKLWSQNDLPLRPAERVAAYTAEAPIDYRLKPLTPTKQRSSRIPELETAGVAHTLLDIDARQIEQLLGDAPEALQLELPTSARSEIVLDLVRVDLFTSDFTVVESGGGTAAVAPGLHYRGIVRGDENSLVAISIFPGEMMGMISTATENLVVGRRHGANGEEQHVVYDDRRIPPPGDYECQTPDDQVVYDREELAPLPDGARGGSSNCVRLYWEADYSIFVKHGSSSAVQSFMTGLFNQVATLYANESVNLTLSQLYVWTTADPFNFSSASDMLNAFKSTRTTFNGDLAGLISFESSGGIAYVDALCNTKYAYGFMSIQNSYATAPTYSWSVNCVAHEFGHLLGSQHTHACVWNGNGTAIDGCYTPQGSCAKPGLPTGGGTVMSYCHLTSVGVNFTLGFGPQPGNLIRNRVSNATCLTTCTTSGGGTTTPPPPSTTGVAIQSDTIALATSGPSNWIKVTFAQAFSQKPIVVVGAPSYNETDPTTVRVRNISTTGFEVQLDEWNYLNGIHAKETVTYIAVTPGVHSLNGVTLLAGNVDGVTNLVKAVTFSNSFSSTPVVLATQVTNNDGNATTVRLSSITTTQFRVRLQEQEKTTDSGKHNAESVNYIALSLGSGTLGDRPVWVGRTGRSVSNNWTTFTFGKSFSTVPTLIAASQSVYDSNPAAVRYRTLQGTSVQLMMEEEKSMDTEVTHAAEVIGVFVIGRTANNTTTTGGTCPPINFNQQPVLSFGGTQDAGTSSIQDGGITLLIQNNAWKAIALNYTVTPNTVIEFDFKSTLQGEVHGLGFDTDNSISSNFTFRVYGTQTWGYSNYNNYAAGAGTWKTYRIPVGQFYTGTFTRLFFAADNDAGTRTGNSYFRNVRLYEGSTCTSPNLQNGVGFNTDEVLEVQPVQLFPNPATDELTLSFSTVQPGAADVEVYNVTGQQLLRQNLQLNRGYQKHRLDVTSLPAGAYFLRLTTADGQETLPFVVARQ